MSALITSMEHALATAASDTVKVEKFVETSVLPVLRTAQAQQSTIEATATPAIRVGVDELDPFTASPEWLGCWPNYTIEP